MGIQMYHSTFTVQEYWSLLVWHFISLLVEVSTIFGCNRILTIVLEISSATTDCDLTEVLKQGQSVLGMWLSLLTRLESTAQHSNSSLMCIVGSSCCFCEVLKKKINTKQSSYMFHSKKSFFFTIVLHSPLPLTYSVGSIFMYFEQVL